MPRSIILLVSMQPHQSQPNQPTPIDTNQLGIQRQNIPILNAPELSKMDTEEYFRQYKALLSQFQGNVDCRVIPSRKGGDTFTLTKAGRDAIEYARQIRNELYNEIPRVALDLKIIG